MLHEKSLPVQDHILHTLSIMRAELGFFAANARCVQFDYNEATKLVRFSRWAVEHMQIPEEAHLPEDADKTGFALADIERISAALRATTKDHPCTELSMLLPIDGELRWHHVSLCSLWSDVLTSARNRRVMRKFMRDNEEKRGFHHDVTGILRPRRRGL